MFMDSDVSFTVKQTVSGGRLSHAFADGLGHGFLRQSVALPSGWIGLAYGQEERV